MRNVRSPARVWAILMVAWLGGSSAQAVEPTYRADPFGDGEVEPSLVLDAAYEPTRRLQVGVMLSTSVIDSYLSHYGGMVDATYFFHDTLGVSAAVGFMHGRYTSIVTSPGGVIAGLRDACEPECTSLDPGLPDMVQVTGLLDATVVWAPLYGKVNLVSEAAMRLRLYGLAGGGVHGTRQIEVEAAPRSQTGYRMANAGVGAGGFLSRPKPHLTLGAGVSALFTERWSVRAEFRAIGFRDEYTFDEVVGPEGYTSIHYFGQAGVAYLF